MQIKNFKTLVQPGGFSLLLISSGCGTMVSHFHDCGGTPAPGVYRGVVFDAACVAAPFSSEPQPQLLPVGLIDFPFSFAIDTIIFPFDLADYILRKNSEKEPSQQPNQSRSGSQPPASPGAMTLRHAPHSS